MSAQIIDGRPYAADLRRQIAAEAADLTAAGRRPGLATLLIDYAARAYERRVRKIAGAIGCHYTGEQLPQQTGRPRSSRRQRGTADHLAP